MRRGILLVVVLATLVAGAAAPAAEPDWYYLHPDLLFASGRHAVRLSPGSNDVRHLLPGVYFLGRADGQPCTKVLVLR